MSQSSVSHEPAGSLFRTKIARHAGRESLKSWQSTKSERIIFFWGTGIIDAMFVVKQDEDKRPAKRCRRQVVDSFPEVLRVLVENGWIGARELGLVGLTSQTARAWTLEDELWSFLCRRRWPNTAHVPLVERRGHRWLYRMRSRGFPQRAVAYYGVAGSMEPPSLTCHGLALLVDIQFEGRSIMSRSLTGEALIPLLQTGTLTLPLDEMLELGDFTPLVLSDDEEDVADSDDVAYDPSEEVSHDFLASMHLIHVADDKMCCVFQSDFVKSCDSVTKFERELEIDANIKTTVFGIEFDDTARLIMKESATELKERIFLSMVKDWSPNRLLAEFQLESGAYGFRYWPQIQLELGLLPHATPCVEAEDGSIRAAENLDLVSKRLLIGYGEVRIAALLRVGGPWSGFCESRAFNSEEEGKLHGVTLLHFLDNLDWTADEG